MKKLLLLAVLGSAVLTASAQDNQFAPKKGSFSTEIQFAPFSGTKIFSNGGVLQARYFCTSKDAFVVELGLAGTNDKDVPNGDQSNTFSSNYDGTFQLNLGYQRHFYTYKRLDLYAGGKIGYIHNFKAQKEQADENNWDWNNEGTGNGFSLYATTGFDFYVYKGLYLGAELNVGFKDVIKSGATYKYKEDGVLTELKTKVGGHSFKGGFDVNPLIRLGWTF
ncbi:MAG: hypothetical protein J1E97_03935 [Muribaculaceae bacterium]|nr:hypothetical protein [Muribaculaceae bacterium]